MVIVEYNGRDQNWQDETTIYWFILNGKDYGTGVTFDNSIYGLADNNGDITLLDSEGYPIVKDSGEYIAVQNTGVSIPEPEE